MIYPQVAPPPDHPTLKELQTDWAIVLLLQIPPIRPVPLRTDKSPSGIQETALALSLPNQSGNRKAEIGQSLIAQANVRSESQRSPG